MTPIGTATAPIARWRPGQAERLVGWSALAVGVGFTLAVALLPVVWMLATSVKPPGEYVTTAARLMPETLTGRHYAGVVDAGLLRQLANSLIVTIGATALSLVVGFAAAYALVRLRFPWRLDLVFLALVLMIKLMPPIVVAVPVYQILDGMGLIDTLAGLILAHQLYTLPFAIWMLMGFLADIPPDYEEAAAVDGASTVHAMATVVLPLAAPGLAATAVFTAILTWNEFLFALLFITSPDTATLPLAIANRITEDETLWGPLMAIGTLASLPVLIAMGYLQRHLLAGFSGGLR